MFTYQDGKKKKKEPYQSIGLAVTLKHLDKWSVGLYVTLAWGLPNVKGRPDLTSIMECGARVSNTEASRNTRYFFTLNRDFTYN